MKKTILAVSSIMMLASTAFTSCNNADADSANAVVEKNVESKATNMKIAFVLIDTLTSQYQKCKDLEAEFTKKRANAEATVQQKGKAFASQVQEFQRKAQSNQYTQNEYNNEQARLQKVQQDIQELQARLSTTLQEDYQKEFQALTDTIQSFAKTYAKQKGYDFILCKSSGIDNVLYADEKYDITAEVVAALNKRYTKKASSDAKK
ncbi:MAG: OmpH family outer membrane protein [Bacteroidaceae bacterium]|nr:OmpH family outer membrane protein [Bacteroidaceae bacterium]